MHTKKAKSFNSQLNSYIIKEFKLQRREASIFYRLLGFLIRNDYPFSYSVSSLVENTLYSRRSIFLALNALETMKLIEREGETNRIKFKRGSCFNDAFSLVQNSMNNEHKVIHNESESAPNEVVQDCTLVQPLHELIPTSAMVAYNKTLDLLKRNSKNTEPVAVFFEKDEEQPPTPVTAERTIRTLIEDRMIAKALPTNENLLDELEFYVTNRKEGKTVNHAINIALKLVREKRWTRPSQIPKIIYHVEHEKQKAAEIKESMINPYAGQFMAMISGMGI